MNTNIYVEYIAKQQVNKQKFEQYLKFKFMFNSTCAVWLSSHMTQR